nr:NAD(P)-dependent oxidoreductase [Syntrophorhabdaceae bacterium]
MKKIGFIGLGYLGKTIAGRLISQGEELVIWNRTIEKGRGMSAELADCPKQVAQRSDVIF